MSIGLLTMSFPIGDRPDRSRPSRSFPGLGASSQSDARFVPTGGVLTAEKGVEAPQTPESGPTERDTGPRKAPTDPRMTQKGVQIDEIWVGFRAILGPF